MIETSILVVGAGAIGGVTAAKMTDKVRQVAVLDANEEHVERMRGDGLLIDELGEESRVRLDAYADPGGLDGTFDFALITLKAPHLEGALGPLFDRGLVNAYVSLGNGLVQEHIAGIVGQENLIWGTVEWGSTNLGPGHLARTTRGPFIIGEADGSVRDRTTLLADALGTVDEARVTENIRGQVWSKLLVNSTFSGLGVVTGLLYQEIAEDPAGREAAYALWREGFAVYAVDLRGRGRSEGERFYVENVAEYVSDVEALVRFAKSREPGLPLFLLGHSAGGVVSCTYALEHQAELAGLICESFAFKVPAPDFVLAIIKGLSRMVPRLRVLKLRNKDFSRDPKAVQALDNDPLTANEVQPAITVAALVRADERLKKEFSLITLPLFILHGTVDKATLPSGSRFFYETAGSKDKTLKLYEGHFHDLLNDFGKEGVMADIGGWIDERLRRLTGSA
jgi:acylglycerol lipase